MIIMALDHTRDFFHDDAFLHDPLDLKTTTPWLFFTRWITHFCAPVFVFLSGTSIYLQSIRLSKKELRVFLLKRGIWLILVEMFIISFLWTFDLHYRSIILQVIWAIGISMVFMGFFIFVPIRIAVALGVLLVAGHNILDFYPDLDMGLAGMLLFDGNFSYFPLFGNHGLVIIYPFVPWLGLMMLGYGLGTLYHPDRPAANRQKTLALTGVGLLVFWCFLRYANIYGDPVAWSQQKNTLFTILSFVNLHKYPPSLLFLCMTIGAALLVLSVSEKINNTFSRWVILYGRVPFFYYILHFLVLHVLCMIMFLFRGHSFFEATPDIFGIPFAFMIAGEGYSLPTVYMIWIAVVVLLYPACWLYNKVKTEKNYPWMRYL